MPHKTRWWVRIKYNVYVKTLLWKATAIYMWDETVRLSQTVFGSSLWSLYYLFSSFWYYTLYTLTWSPRCFQRVFKVKTIFIIILTCSVAQSCLTLCDPMNRSTSGLPVHHQLPEFTQTHVHRVGDAINLILCHPLLLLPPIAPSIRVFSSESALRMRWPKYWSFSFNISPSNEQPGLISFRMDWLDLLAVQRTHNSLLQHHSSKASIFWCSAFFTVQFSHPYMTTGKTIALTRWTFVGKVMSLLFNMLSRLVITFLPRSKCLLISWLNHHLQWFWSPQN